MSRGGDQDASDEFNKFGQAVMEALKAKFPGLTTQHRSRLAEVAWQQGYKMETLAQALAFCAESINIGAATVAPDQQQSSAGNLETDSFSAGDGSTAEKGTENDRQKIVLPKDQNSDDSAVEPIVHESGQHGVQRMLPQSTQHPNVSTEDLGMVVAEGSVAAVRKQARETLQKAMAAQAAEQSSGQCIVQPQLQLQSARGVTVQRSKRRPLIELPSSAARHLGIGKRPVKPSACDHLSVEKEVRELLAAAKGIPYLDKTDDSSSVHASAPTVMDRFASGFAGTGFKPVSAGRMRQEPTNSDRTSASASAGISSWNMEQLQVPEESPPYSAPITPLKLFARASNNHTASAGQPQPPENNYKRWVAQRRAAREQVDPVRQVEVRDVATTADIEPSIPAAAPAAAAAPPPPPPQAPQLQSQQSPCLGMTEPFEILDQSVPAGGEPAWLPPKAFHVVPSPPASKKGGKFGKALHSRSTTTQRSREGSASARDQRVSASYVNRAMACGDPRGQDFGQDVRYGRTIAFTGFGSSRKA